MTTEHAFTGLVNVETVTGVGFKEVIYEVRDRRGCPFLILRIARPRFELLPGGGGVDPLLAVWEAALQTLVGDCLQIAKDDRHMLAELVAATLNTLPYYATCTTPIVTHKVGVHTVFVAYVGLGDWDSWLQ